MRIRHQAGLTGRGTPRRDLEKAADRQAKTTGGINYPGTDVNREPHPDESRPQEATQGDWASGDLAGGASLSVGNSGLEGSETEGQEQTVPLLDTCDLEAVFEDLDFPCEREEVVAVLENREDDHPIPGVDLPEVVASLPEKRFMNLSELIAAVREELDRRMRTASA